MTKREWFPSERSKGTRKFTFRDVQRAGNRIGSDRVLTGIQPGPIQHHQRPLRGDFEPVFGSDVPRWPFCPWPRDHYHEVMDGMFQQLQRLAKKAEQLNKEREGKRKPPFAHLKARGPKPEPELPHHEPVAIERKPRLMFDRQRLRNGTLRAPNTLLCPK